MREHPTTTNWPIERGFNLAFGIAVVASAVGMVLAFVAGSEWGALAGFPFLGLAVGLYAARSRGIHPKRLAVGLAVTVMLVGAWPETGPAIALLIVVTQVIIAFDIGFGLSAVIGVVYVLILGVVYSILYDTRIVNVAIENGLYGLLLVLLAGVGSLMRTAENSRAQAAAMGADLTLANAALRRSLLLERDLVLAEERARSARELHDGLGHRLTLVSLSLEYAAQTWRRDPEKAWAEVETAAATNREALSEMRLWVRALDPPVADEGVAGAAAFDAIADAFRGTGLDVRVSYRGAGPALDHDVALFATRLIQESLTNVLRHAHASRVDIDVIQSPHQVRFSIGDDGTGATSPAEGFGRRSLRERAEILGGVMTAGTSALGGFELSAVVPLTQEL